MVGGLFMATTLFVWEVKDSTLREIGPALSGIGTDRPR